MVASRACGYTVPMPRTTTATAEKEDAKNKDAEATLDDKLDLIVLYLHRMDRRDRLRTIGGFFRGVLGLIPLALLIWSFWYFAIHGQEFMQEITREAVRQSAEYSQGSLMEQLEQYMNEGQ